MNIDRIPDRADPRSVALWIMARWQTTCEPHLGRHDAEFKEYLTDLIVVEIQNQRAELTKLKADVERLRGALQGCIDCKFGYRIEAARALEETK